MTLGTIIITIQLIIIITMISYALVTVADVASKAITDWLESQNALVCTPLPALPMFSPAPKHPLLNYSDLYMAARAARNTLTIEQFFALAFDKAPSATPDSFAALTPKQIATLRGKIHKAYNANQACKARACAATAG